MGIEPRMIACDVNLCSSRACVGEATHWIKISPAESEGPAKFVCAAAHDHQALAQVLVQTGIDVERMDRRVVQQERARAGLL